MSARLLYRHTQVGWTMMFAVGLGTAFALAVLGVRPGMQFDAPLPGAVLALLIGLPMALLLAFGWLTVSLENDRLAWRFGLGWPRKSLPLAEIATVEPTRTRFAEGWGIHLTRRGWLYNVSGFDAVLVIRRDGKALMIGTDEPRALAGALRRALGQPPRS